MNDEIELGPVDYLIVEWPAGKQPTGEGISELLARIHGPWAHQRARPRCSLQKNEDGSVSGLALMDLDSDGDLDLVGSSAGLRRACSARTTNDEAGFGARAGRLGRDPSSTRTAGRAPFVARQ